MEEASKSREGTGWEVVLIIFLLLMALAYGAAYYLIGFIDLIRNS